MADHSRTYAIGRHRWIGFGVLAAAVVGLATVVSFSTTVSAFDAALGSLARTDQWGSLVAFSTDISALASTDLIVPVTAAAVALLAVVRHWHGALTLALSVLATQAVVHLVKVLVERPRPEANDGITAAGGHSFPSAHSATAVALYLTLALVVAHRCTGWARAAVLGAGGAVVVAIGLSRIQLGAHYPIDVVAGWLTGAALVLAIWALVGRLAVRPAPRPA